MRTPKISLTLTAVLITIATVTFGAENEAASNPDVVGGYNVLLLTLVGLMLILLFFIGMLANTLRILAISLKDKNKKEKNAGKVIGVLALLALLLPSGAFAAAAETATAAVVETVSPTIGGIVRGDFYAIMAMIIFELIIIFALAIYTRILIRLLSNKTAKAAEGSPVVRESWFWDTFNKAVPIEKERDLLLDHDYDGIQELDNSLPPWWLYGFYATIVVGIIYLYRYEISHEAPNQKEEYEIAMQEGEAQKQAYLAKSANNVDEQTVVLLTDAASLGEGKDLFSKNCVACHLADGGGSVGPNLTDEFWLHSGSIKDVFKSIKYGWQEKGMKSWKDDFSPKQIQEIASFVKSLKGTKPATPKAPQGELYIEAGATNTTSADSTGGKGDSTVSKTDTTHAAK